MSGREKMVEAISKYLCIRFGIEPIDSMDGGSNWWMFHNDVDALIAGFEKRGFRLPDAIKEPPQNFGPASGVAGEENPGETHRGGK